MNTLKQLTDTQYALQAECKEYWKTNIVPRIEACKTRDDVRNVMHEVSLACADDNGQIREMPRHFIVSFVLAISSFPREVL